MASAGPDKEPDRESVETTTSSSWAIVLVTPGQQHAVPALHNPATSTEASNARQDESRDVCDRTVGERLPTEAGVSNQPEVDDVQDGRPHLLKECFDDQNESGLQPVCLDSCVMGFAEVGSWMYAGAHLHYDMNTVQKVSPPQANEQVLHNFKTLKSYNPFLVRNIKTQLNDLWSSAEEASTIKYVQWEYYRRPCSISPAVRKRLVLEAGRNADVVETLFIARFCTDDERQVLLTEVVNRSSWRLASLFIARGMASQSNHQWVLEEAARSASSSDIQYFILPCCTSRTDNDPVLRVLVSRCMFDDVIRLLQRNVCSKESHTWALTEACKLIKPESLPIFLGETLTTGLTMDGALTEVTRTGKWGAVCRILRVDCVCDSESRLVAVQEAVARADNSFLQGVFCSCTVEELDFVLLELAKHRAWRVVHQVFSRPRPGLGEAGRMDLDPDSWHLKLYKDDSWLQRLSRFNDVVVVSLLGQALKQDLNNLLDYLFARERHYAVKFGINSTLHHHGTADDACARLARCSSDFPGLFSKMSSVFDGIFAIIDTDFTDEGSGRWPEFLNSVQSWTQSALACHAVVSGTARAEWEKLLLLCLMERVAKVRSAEQLAPLQRVLALVPIVPLVQNVAIKTLASRDEWKLIRNTCWFYVQEKVRRYVFHQALWGLQWRTVKLLVDHTLHDDQRDSVLTQAIEDSHWFVIMSLAEHGLADDELCYLYNQMTKLKWDWKATNKLWEEGADVNDVIAEFTSVTSVIDDASDTLRTPQDRQTVKRNRATLDMLMSMREKLKSEAEDFESAIQQHNWAAVLYKIRHGKVSRDQTELATEAAIHACAWHVMVQLAKWGRLARTKRDSLFRRMMEGQRWSVCRALLERGLSPDLCERVLPRLLEARQWILAARVTEQGINDSSVHHVLQAALDEGEDTLAAHCIGNLRKPLTATERQEVFSTALDKGLWWTVMRLTKEDDHLGKAQRDAAFVEASEHEQWDVIRHCLQRGAKADVRDRQGRTLLQVCAMQQQWRRAEELLHHGADPNLVDPEGYQPLHRASHKVWFHILGNFINTLLQFHGDINQPDPREGRTPLSYLISQKRTDHIDTALRWGQNVAEPTDIKGQTVLHAACEAGSSETVRHLVARGCDPLAKTAKGKTLLYIATEGALVDMVAECIRLGVSTFQPKATDRRRKQRETFTKRSPSGLLDCEAASPLQKAAARGDVAMMETLYQAGACSYAELRRFHVSLKKDKSRSRSTKWKELSAYVERLARTPRTLKSSCRLVISHSLGVQWKRERRVVGLTQLGKSLREYVLFADLTGSV